MVRVKIAGIPVDLPYTPYPPQLATIAKLIECFQTNTNALIESPTGTGKSLSILCSALAYLEHHKRNAPPDSKPFKIFVCSRTHKQLDQLVEQLRKTAYNPRITILGSKNHYCINPLLNRVEDKNAGCEDLMKKKSCALFNNKDRLVLKIGGVFDIEELKREGKSCGGCPYYAARALQENAEVIFAPYNYLVDKSVREASEVKLDNAILIIDEAHNIEDCCRAAGSLEIKSRQIDSLILELNSAVKTSAMLGELKADFSHLAVLFKGLKARSEEEAVDIKKGKEIIAVLEQLGMGAKGFVAYKDALQAILKSEEAKKLLALATVRFLQELEGILGFLLFGRTEAYAYCFSRGEDGGYTYNFWLLDPSVMFLPLVSNVKSISLLSGTLSPFSSFCSELKFQFHHQLAAPHIIRPEQAFIAVIRRGHLRQELCGTYQVANTPGYLEQVCRVVDDVSRRAKGGTLVFVPSYSFLNRISGKLREAVYEPRDGGMKELEKVMEKYRERIRQGREAVFVCVYRGKAAEGVDFRDELARAVVAVGIPYPALKDAQIELKKEYNDKGGGFNGRMWYEAQAYRAVNQALGRVIRHIKDWGAVFLVDSRYGERRYQSGLSNWVVGNLRVYESYEGSMKEYESFTSKQVK